MRSANVVIGAGYGDEGKGLVTDLLASTPGSEALVIRFNGGAQAGHTVQTANARRHVFGHFGSGSFCGAATYLSRFFVCHPMLFQAERQALLRLGASVRTFVDPEAPVTTPYDVMINQHLEAFRGAARHGSCGIGFGETLEREEVGKLKLHVGDLTDPSRLTRILTRIRDEYLPHRLAKLNLPALDATLLSDEIFDRYLQDAADFVAQVDIQALSSCVQDRQLIFEGAQGLLLDMDHGQFPHVTRSNTGLTNVQHLAKDINVDHVNVHYVTRAYVTRHGAGPLAHEIADKPWPGVVDETNVGNSWQGSLRFGWLDLDVLAAAIQQDRSECDLQLSPKLVMTCLDQVAGELHYVAKGRLQCGTTEQLLSDASRATAVDHLSGCFGPNRRHLHEMN
jgi:adenylosuccinate synthase